MLTVTKLGLPPELRRSLACTNIIENVMGTVRRVSRNVKYWRSPSMALRWGRVTVIDEDLGLSGSGAVELSGFARLAAEVGLGHVGIVLGLEVSRLARNNAD